MDHDRNVRLLAFLGDAKALYCPLLVADTRHGLDFDLLPIALPARWLLANYQSLGPMRDFMQSSSGP